MSEPKPQSRPKLNKRLVEAPPDWPVIDQDRLVQAWAELYVNVARKRMAAEREQKKGAA